MLNKKPEEFDKLISILESKKSISVKLNSENLKTLIRLLTLSKETINTVSKTGLEDVAKVHLAVKEYSALVDSFVNDIVKIIEEKNA